MTPADHVNKANETLRFAQSLTAYLIAGAMSEYEPEPTDIQDLGFQLQNHLTAIDECLQALWEAVKNKPEPPTETVTTPESRDYEKLTKISKEISKITDEDLKRRVHEPFVKVYREVIGRELGFIPTPEDVEKICGKPAE